MEEDGRMSLQTEVTIPSEARSSLCPRRRGDQLRLGGGRRHDRGRRPAFVEDVARGRRTPRIGVDRLASLGGDRMTTTLEGIPAEAATLVAAPLASMLLGEGAP